MRRRPAVAVLAAIVGAELLHSIVAAAQHRVPFSHDGFQYFTLQYYFLNDAIQSAEIAQWIPFMNQGTVASLWRGIQSALLQNVLLEMPVLARQFNLLTIYHAGMFVDAMVLLTGTWLLARRFFGPTTAVFISLSVVGGTVWIDQPYWNFKLVYAVPLLIELGHRFLETGRWRWAFLLANLLAMQMLGSLPYIIPVTSFAVAAYFLAYSSTHHRLVIAQLRSLRFGWRAVVSMTAAILSLAMAYAYFTSGTGDLVNYNASRNADGTTTLPVFLTYGGSTDVAKWIDMVLNLSPWMDLTLYSGILILPLTLVAVLVVDRHRVHFLLVTLVLLLFTLGTPVSSALFYTWPGMKFFRHIGLVSPLVRVGLCFVAGVAFEAIVAGERRQPNCLRFASVLLSVLLLAAGLFAHWLSSDPAATRALVDALSNPGTDRPTHVRMPDVLAHRLSVSATAAWIAGGLLMLGAIVRTKVSSRPRLEVAWIATLLLLIFVDVYRFKFGYLSARTERMPSAVQSVTWPSALPYPVRRRSSLKDAAVDGSNPRLEATIGFSSMFRYRLQGRASSGAQYWTNNAFVFADEAGSTFQVDSWLKPFDELLRMYWEMPIDNTSGFPPGIDLRALEFPLTHPAASKVTGISENKIRFFSRAFSVDTADALPPLMMSPQYRGNRLFVLRQLDQPNQGQSALPWNPNDDLTADDTQHVPYEVQRFSSNVLRLAVSNTAGATWISYADVWHPYWHATVNGRPAPIYRANMAYKAVPLEKGQNIVELRFGSSAIDTLAKLIALNSAVWLGLVVWMSGLAIREEFVASRHEIR
jgi:hypothetical protein